MYNKHIFSNGVEVLCSTNQQASGSRLWWVRVYVNNELRLSTHIEAESSKDAALAAKDMVVL